MIPAENILVKENFDPILYLGRVSEAMAGTQDSIRSAWEMMRLVKKKNRTVWCLGNGGSLAIAQHFAQDLLKMGDMRAQSINCPSIITAYTNDQRFEDCFFTPVRRLSEPSDLIVIFSCSGKSRNYIEFISNFSEERRNPIIAIVGTNGGFLSEKADCCVHIKSDDYQICETAFCVVSDLLVKLMEDK